MKEELIEDAVKEFLASKVFAVAGASSDRFKYGNKVLRCYASKEKKVYAINPNEDEIEGVPCYHSVTELPDDVTALSIVTQPEITVSVVMEAIEKGIHNIWIQPGAESQTAIDICLEKHINLIYEGPCVLRTMGCHET